MQKVIIRSLLLAIVMIGCIDRNSAGIFAGGCWHPVGFAPPAIPVYDQPACPGDGYYWTPGYWAWDADFDDYYWVPGTWVEPPDAGLLWTPGYWGWNGAAFVFTDGYWGPTIGFYGGINYGFGYFGNGFVGGRWDGGHFYLQLRGLARRRRHPQHLWDRVTIVNNTHVSYNGGNGGVSARATAAEEAARNGRHVEPVAAQRQQMDARAGIRACARRPITASLRSQRRMVRARSTATW